MNKSKQRPSGLKYTKTKYSAIYEKLKEFISNQEDLPTVDEFFREADSLARVSGTKDCFGAMLAIRRMVLTAKNAQTKTMKKFKVVNRDGKEYVDVNQETEENDK